MKETWTECADRILRLIDSIYTQWLHQRDNNVADQFWRDKLKGFQAPTPLYSDPSLPWEKRAESARYGEAEVSIPLATSNCIRQFANQESVTINTLVMAAWAILLMRYSGHDEVVFDVTKSARHCGMDRADEMVVGLFLNTLPMRVSAVAELPLREFLLAVRSDWLSLRKYEFTPLVDIRCTSEVPISQPRSESLVVLENQRFSTELQSLGSRWSNREIGLLEQTNYTITLAAYNDPEFVLKLEFDSNRFTRETINRMLSHLVALLEGMLANPNCQIGAIPLLTAGECRQLVEWNDTAIDFPRNTSLNEFIEAQVERTPDALALICESQELTYRELNQRANQLASRLRRMGVSPDKLVAVYAERSVEMVVALLGTMKAGGAYVPLDPEYPSARLSVMLEDAEPVAVLTQEHLLNLLPSHHAAAICLDRDWPDLNTEPTENIPVLTGGNHAAYVIYTSGSTGKPKGVLNVHSGIVNRLLWMQHQFQLNSTDSVLQKTPYSFDVSVWEFFWPLMTGACLVMARPDGHKDPGYLVDIIAEREITTIHFVPSMLSVFLDTGNLDRCAGLRRVICSGEALPFELQEKFFQGMSAELYNLYGPTEAAVDVSFWQCRPDTQLRIVPIGKPIWNTQLHVLDKHLQPVPIGVPGELHIGGVQLARGYLKRPELTLEKFIPDPFSAAVGQRLYKTGDLARFLDTGDIEYLGRIDHQVKIRGLRIELGEIDAALGDCPGVKEHVVLAREDRPSDKRLVAYVVPVPGEEPSPVDLTERLKQRLPEYMVPTAYVFLPRFPLNSNGKLDRRALPAPDLADFGPVTSYFPPTDIYEEMLCDIWAETLGRDRVGIHDNFFELGGYSLLAVRALARILEKWPYHKLTIAAFIQSPTIAQFATVIRSGRQIKAESLVPFRVQGNKYPLFCIPGAGGNVVSMRRFSSGFSVDQPLYCLQAKGLDGSEPLRTVQDQARFYISEIRKVQPSGPYHLAGTSFGGLVAFEMARILHSQDEAVGLLALLDTYNPAFASTLSKRQLFNAHFSFCARRAAFHVRRFRRIPWRKRLRYLKANAAALSKHAAELLRSALGQSGRTVHVPPMNDIGDEHRGFLTEVLHLVAEASALAASQYVPKYYDGEVVVFTASERLVEPYQDDALGWRPFARSVEAIELPGNHQFFLNGPGGAVAVHRIEQATGKKNDSYEKSSDSPRELEMESGVSISRLP